MTRSPARAGTIAFTPAPATYAPKTLRSRGRASGYDAWRIVRQATARRRSLSELETERDREELPVHGSEVVSEDPYRVEEVAHT